MLEKIPFFKNYKTFFFSVFKASRATPGNAASMLCIYGIKSNIYLGIRSNIHNKYSQ